MAKFEIIIKDFETGEELVHSKAKVIVGGYVPDEEKQEGMTPANGMVAVAGNPVEMVAACEMATEAIENMEKKMVECLVKGIGESLGEVKSE